MLRRWLPLVLSLLGLSLLPSPCRAEGEAAADALFRAGREAAERGDWSAACDRFHESHRLDPAPGTALNLARCREQLGQLALAWQHYGEVVERLDPSDERARYAARKRTELKERLPWVTLSASAEVLAASGLRVTVDGLSVSPASFGVPLPFDPGHIVVEVSADGYQPERLELELTEGGSVERSLRLGPKTDAGHGSASGRRTAGFVTLGVGGALVLTGVAGVAWTFVEMSTVNDHCTPDGRCDSTGIEAGERGRTAVIVASVAGGLGLLGATTGLILLTRGRGSEQKAARVTVSPLVGGAFLSLGGEL